MKIIMCSFQSVSLFRGGVRTQVLKTMEGLEKKGIDVEFFDQWKNYDDYDRDKTIFHVFTASNRTYFLVEAIKRKGFKVVVSSIFYREINPSFLKLQNKIHNLIKYPIYTGNSCGKTICELADVVLPNSNDESIYIQKSWEIDKNKIKVIPNGVDLKFKGASPDEFVNKYDKKDFVLGVGTLHTRKNFDLLAEVCEDMNLPLVLIGDLDENTYKGRKIKKIIDRNNNFLWIKHIDNKSTLLQSAYAACKIVALPSDFETPGLVAMEGALTGANILITEIGGTKDYFKDMAYYVKPRCKKSIKEGLIKLNNNVKNIKLSDHIYNNFSWDIVAEKTLEQYKRVLLEK